MWSKPEKWETIVLKGPERVHITRHSRYGDHLDYYKDCDTLYKNFCRGLEISGDKPCLGEREPNLGPYRWLTYKQIYDLSQQFGSGLLNIGHQPGQETKIGIFSSNRKEWVIADMGCQFYSMIDVPLYDTFGPDACHYIIQHAGLETVVVDTREHVDTLLKIAANSSVLKTIILVNMDENIRDEAARIGIKVISFHDVLKSGEENLRDVIPPQSSDVCSIYYTSGTTGEPKGVMVTHASLLSSFAMFNAHLEGEITITKDDTHLSYLPLPHIMERTVQVTLFSEGAKIGFFSGDINLLFNDVKELKPTIFPSVPRLLTKLHDMVMAGVQSLSAAKRKLFYMALYFKKRQVKRGIFSRDTIWDRMIFNKIQNELGGRVRLLLTGSAPIASHVLDFYRCVFGCVVIEGYGQTEWPIFTMTKPCETEAGHVGLPLPCIAIKLVDTPELGYYSKDDKGEICVKTPIPFPGYYKDPEKTSETVDMDGYIYTGDIGQWLPNGCLKIIDRKKHIFKLAQGEYIAPEKIENIYQSNQLVLQAYVDGHSIETYLVGVVIPDPDTFSYWARDLGITGTMEELCSNREVKKQVLSSILKTGKRGGLKSFEQVRNILLHPNPLTVEDGFLTATQKKKRPFIRKYFANTIDKLYKNTADMHKL